MNTFLHHAIRRSRTTLSLMFFLLLMGIFAYRNIPIEMEPNIEVPIAVVTIVHEGISPEDAERLIILPLETEVRAMEKVEEIRGYASEGQATLVVEFDIEVDSDDAAIKLNEAIDRARPKIPSTAEEPIVNTISTVDFPGIVVNLSGENVPERVLYQLAVKLKEDIESSPDVQEARLSGQRQEILEVLLDPALMESYGITAEELIANVFQNNRLVAAGAMDAGNGRFAVKVPGLIETSLDAYRIPVKRDGDTVITLEQVASIQRTFADRVSFAHVNGSPSISIEVIKRVNANMINMVANVRALVESARTGYPEKIDVTYTTDQAPEAQRQVDELKGNILTAMMLVMTLVVAALGLRSGLLVGFSIPFSFLCSYILLNWIGYTFNFMVMFGMLLALGMLIDGAIVVIEYADRKMAEGLSREKAYYTAAKRMFWPVVASTATTLAVFLPLFFWPGVSGKFMLHLPVTVFTILVGSLMYALFFGPTIGSKLGKVGSSDIRNLNRLRILESGDPTTLGGITGRYARLLGLVARWPVLITAATVAILVSSFAAYQKYGSGVIFFADLDPVWATISINARGNLSAREAYRLVSEAEREVLAIPGIKSLYTSASAGNRRVAGRGDGGGAQDRIGYMFIELHEQTERNQSGREILERIRQSTAHLHGIKIEVQKLENGPPVGKPIQVEFASKYGDILEPAVTRVMNYLENEVSGLRDVEDTRSLPGIEWELSVDRDRAAQFGANVTTVGYAVQLVTNGVRVGEYRPDDALEEIDIRVRFPSRDRGIQALESLRLVTPQGQVPLSSFVTLKPRQATQTIQRIDSSRVEYIRADVAPGVFASDKTAEIQAWLETQSFDPRMSIKFRGANEEQQEAGQFLGVAFMMALLLMFIMLVTQFNSFYHAFLIMFAVIMSTAGVLISLLILDQPFSVILTGVGIVALAGIVVNNNIVLLDTFTRIRKQHPEMPLLDAIVRTGAQRFRPVVLTTATTVLGLLPIATHLSLNFINREITYGSSTTAYWTPLASAIVSGLMFATLLTLITTPAMIALPESLARHAEPAGRLWRKLLPRARCEDRRGLLQGGLRGEVLEDGR